MKTFFGSVFIDKDKLLEARIGHIIKLEYYKIIDEENKKYGIRTIKKEYMGNKTRIEEKTINYLSNDEQKIEDILNILKRNEVTPVCVEEIISDLSK